jgi:hypothetical protein
LMNSRALPMAGPGRGQYAGGPVSGLRAGAAVVRLGGAQLAQAC